MSKVANFQFLLRVPGLPQCTLATLLIMTQSQTVVPWLLVQNWNIENGVSSGTAIQMTFHPKCVKTIHKYQGSTRSSESRLSAMFMNDSKDWSPAGGKLQGAQCNEKLRGYVPGVLAGWNCRGAVGPGGTDKGETSIGKQMVGSRTWPCKWRCEVRRYGGLSLKIDAKEMK